MPIAFANRGAEGRQTPPPHATGPPVPDRIIARNRPTCQFNPALLYRPPRLCVAETLAISVGRGSARVFWQPQYARRRRQSRSLARPDTVSPARRRESLSILKV